ncbi:imidazole glycerol phosphate synthase subunit HisH [Thermospira aquatica]|uniref:Imidazole glycerol phosphate synthase subunit HisH n=1 Tax=Thermospira aquatica TaxID=2828656 RepID=A0AAX3BCP9_9SPIR|nr:imidazole glycerol phosphate synthase subunit HisH [Thermospira aquatica]URA09979.1 imidazole glycerol phosphate synthase subunit HisH [Thermospira aquatica]
MIAIVDYNMGNIASVYNAFVRIGVASEKLKVIRTAQEIEQASALVLPGVGAFNDAMMHLREQNLVHAIQRHVQQQKPLLGICLGYQLLFEEGEEGNKTEGLGLVQGNVVRFSIDLPIPHIGWSTTILRQNKEIFDSLPQNVYFYYDHAYYPEVKESDVIACETEYGIRYVSGIQKGLTFGFQFHPEKSHTFGLRLLSNFVSILSERGFI